MRTVHPPNSFRRSGTRQPRRELQSSRRPAARRPLSADLEATSSARSIAEAAANVPRSEEHTSELQSHVNLVCRLLLEKKKKNSTHDTITSTTTPNLKRAKHLNLPPTPTQT